MAGSKPANLLVHGDLGQSGASPPNFPVARYEEATLLEPTPVRPYGGIRSFRERIASSYYTEDFLVGQSGED